MALFAGESSVMAEAGALLVADALVSLRALEAGAQVKWSGVGRPGI